MTLNVNFVWDRRSQGNTDRITHVWGGGGRSWEGSRQGRGGDGGGDREGWGVGGGWGGEGGGVINRMGGQ